MICYAWVLIMSSFSFCLAGEVERLLKEYRQNQELVRRIGGHYYQIIYPVQLRHHEKMGISTREVSPPKVRKDLHKRNTRKIETDTMVCSLLFSLIRAIVCPIVHTHTHTDRSYWYSLLQKSWKKTWKYFELSLKKTYFSFQNLKKIYKFSY